MGRKTAFTRKCPIHQTLLLREQRKPGLRSVEVDFCPKCEGLFLDKGELKALTGRASLSRLLKRHPSFDPDDPLECPQGDGTMKGKALGGVRIDVCPSCDGVWLDAGEFEQVRDVPDAEFSRLSPDRAEVLLQRRDLTRTVHEAALRQSFAYLMFRKRLWPPGRI